MLVLKLCQQLCPDKIPVIVGAKLGDGADGEVFDILDDADKVIKFCVIYQTGKIPIPNAYKYVSNVLDTLISNPSPTYARVYSHAWMGKFSRDIQRSPFKQSYILYYYIMEKLYKTTEDERKVFHSIISHEDQGKRKDFPLDKIKEMLIGLAQGLDFDEEKVIFFYNNFKKSPVVHLDIHPRNIMKNAAGNFKLIDFDRAEMNHGKK